MPKVPAYKIIYNWDGAPQGYSEYPQSMEQFLEKTYAVMEDTQVGAHFWSMDGIDFLEIKKGKFPIKHPNMYQSASHFTGYENRLAMYERGEDPHEAVIERGRELGIDVYASIRMNDNHFSGMQPDEMAASEHPELTDFRREHPEYLIGDRTSEWFALSYDFSIAAVRQHRFDSIKEICELYNWDGVELDWQRHAFHFDEDYGYRFRYTLTDLQRSVRKLADEISEKRGKPFYLAARVNGYIEMCNNIGYDIETWVDEGLVDILIPAGGADTETEAEVDKFKEICKGTDIVVYPGFDSGVSQMPAYAEGAYIKDQMRTRGLASRHFAKGADGIYVFNWHANGDTRRDLLTTIGSTETLRATDKVYAATRRHLVDEGAWRGAYRKDRLRGTVPVPLRETMTFDGPTCILDVADDFTVDKPRSVELRIRLQDWLKGDKVKMELNGQEISELDTRYEHKASPDPVYAYANQSVFPVSDVTDTVWLSKDISPHQVKYGINKVKVLSVERNKLIESDIVLTDVELVVKFS
jgi:hypothetical protein